MCSQRNPEKLPDRFARTLNDRLGRSHAELRAAVRLAGTRIVKLNFGRKDDPVLELQRRVLRDAREVVKQQKELQWTDPKPMPDEAAEAPEAPLTQESGTKLIREELDRDRAYFKFAKEQAKDDRDLFKHHLDISVLSVRLRRAAPLRISFVPVDAGLTLGRFSTVSQSRIC